MKTNVDWEHELEPGCRCFGCFQFDYEQINIINLERSFTQEEFNELRALVEAWAKDKD